jgi:cbb3-type cytochrome oxidase subunit 3
MLQQLTSETAAQFWSISAMIFFMAVFAVAVFLIAGKRRDELEHCARLPLNDDPPTPREDAEASSQGR